MEGIWKDRLNNISDLREFLTFIPEFFSKNGEATRINFMYDNLHNDDIAPRKIISIDLHVTRSLFNEYANGYLSYLNLHKGDLNLIGTTDVTNDKFLFEIFEGRYNSPVETRLCDAVGNLEVLIDLLPDIDCMIGNQNRLSDKICNESYTNFTLKYLKKMITEIIDTYDNINDTIVGKKKPLSSYKLFM